MQILPPCLLIVIGLVSFSIGYSWAADCTGIGGSPMNIAKSIMVDRSGQGDFTTVQAAINSVPSGNDQWIRILINPGIYKEKVEIPKDKPCIFLDGKGRSDTTITFDAHDQTDSSATFSSFPDNVIVRGITFKNSYNRFWGLAGGIQVKQAVAARVYGDKSLFYGCGFLGFQDTLFDVQGRHYYESCYIEGAIDFIFGNGQSYFMECEINATTGLNPYSLPKGFVTAQGRQSEKELSGFVFRGGVVYGGGEVFLGRAYGPYSRVVFIETILSAAVSPLGWDAWRFKGNEDKIMYSEVNCQGNGSNRSKRVPWLRNLDGSSIEQFRLSSFIDRDGWLQEQPLARSIKRRD